MEEYQKVQNVAKLNTPRGLELLLFTRKYNTPVSFNQGVTGSRPVRPTKAGRPSLPGDFQKNQGVNTLGQPTP